MIILKEKKKKTLPSFRFVFTVTFTFDIYYFGTVNLTRRNVILKYSNLQKVKLENILEKKKFHIKNIFLHLLLEYFYGLVIF